MKKANNHKSVAEKLKFEICVRNCGVVRYKNLDKNIHMDATVRYELEEVSETNNFGLFVNDEKMAT